MECEKCDYDLAIIVEDMETWSQTDENAPVYVTDWRETYDPELGTGADFTLNVRCPECGHVNQMNDGYP